jgi:hypothetical protein
MFCAPELIFGGNEGAGSRFLVLRSRSHFPRYRGRRVPFSCFAHPNSFSAVQRASCPIFMFCAPGHVFGGTEGVESRFHVLRARTHFHGYRGRWVPFSCFALSDSFSEVPSASGPVFMFCVPGLVFDGTEGVSSRFIFCASGLVFNGTEGVGSRFHVLRAQTRFRRYRGRLVPFSCFALPDMFSAMPSASGNIFMFCAPR